MARFERPLEDPVVEELLVDAILRINSEVTTTDSSDASGVGASSGNVAAGPPRLE